MFILLLLSVLAASPARAQTTKPAVSISASASSVTEGESVTFTITATPAPAGDIVVLLGVSDATESDNDFLRLADEGVKNVTIEMGKSSATLDVQTVEDGNDEPDGVIQVSVFAFGSSPYEAGSPSSVDVTVTDNDEPAKPVVTITASASSVTEGEAVTFTITATPAPAQDIVVLLGVSDAIESNNDFLADADDGVKNVTIDAGKSSATLEVETVDDGNDEPDGVIQVSVFAFGSSPYEAGSASSVDVTVNDNDEAVVTPPVITPPPPPPVITPPPPPVVTPAGEEVVEDRCSVSDVSGDEEESLKGFVECAAEEIKGSQTFGETLSLLEDFRERNWNDGSTYLVLLTEKGGVYFHAARRNAEDLNWSGIACEAGEPVLDLHSDEGCVIGGGGYAHRFSPSHVPLAREDEEFIVLGGFSGTPVERPFTEGMIGGPSTEAGDVDSDDELMKFVEEAKRALEEGIEDADTGPAQLRGILRSEGPWREGDNVYVYIMDETGRVIFHGGDRNREQKDESANRYLIAGQGVVEYTEGGMSRRGYAVRAGEAGRMYVVGSGYGVEQQPSGGSKPSGSDGGGGCALGESGGAEGFGALLAALVLLLSVSLRRCSLRGRVFRRR